MHEITESVLTTEAVAVFLLLQQTVMTETIKMKKVFFIDANCFGAYRNLQ